MYNAALNYLSAGVVEISQAFSCGTNLYARTDMHYYRNIRWEINVFPENMTLAQQR